jgi:alpha-maltose-1-phosphate synthase
MKILILCEGDAETRDSWSGVSYGLINGLRAVGHEVRAADCDLYGPSRLLGAGMTFSPRRRRWWVRYHLAAFPFALRSRRARQHVRRAEGWADVVLQFGATFLPRLQLTVPCFLYCDSNIHLSELGAAAGSSEAVQLSRRELAAVRAREAQVYSRARLIFTMSRMVADSFIEGFGIPRSRLVPVHAGVNITPTEAPIRQEDQRPVILFVGRDFERKGGTLLLRAFETVRSKLPEARLVIVGPPSNPASGATGVDYLGFLDPDQPEDKARLESAYQRAAVFCLPTRFEPLGIAYLEAMSFGLPCVGPRAWAVPEMVVHGETGLLVDDDDPRSWAGALLELLTDRDWARRLGERGRQEVAEYYKWDRVASTMSEVIEAELNVPTGS